MKVAEIFSDLTSLRVCGHDEALALVQSYKRLDAAQAAQTKTAKEEAPDADLQRAKDLVALHYDVKVKYVEKGLDEKLQQAREDVKRITNA